MADTFSSIGATIYRLRGAGPAAGPPSAPAAAPAKAEPKAHKLPADPPPERAEEHTIVLGDVLATRGPARLKTLLGSCVSACIFDPKTGVGGMNHFSLPGVSDEGVSARYGAHAMELLVTAVMKKGGDRNRLRAKVFGGGKVLNLQSEHLNVGAKNAEFVIKYLEAESIPVDGQCLGGTSGLIVRFEPHTGRAQAKPLAGRDLPPLVEKEEAFGRKLLQDVKTPTDDVTLF
jgi:chemotaxis receptor (MCP) glutamine deamidase CheD